ncbi:MAG: cation:proton antiporter [Candidatus Doudnabacteria bacterium]|nr:cation:proton antiporter [Candidatus Doudnabacteria bacterium]
MLTGITELAIAITLAAVLSFVARWLRQPLILAYLAAGAIISYFGFFDPLGQETFNIFADLGIMFLLFLVGLEINYNSLRLVGKTSIIIGLGQIIFTSLVGFFIAQGFGFSQIESAYIAIALTFSSTIIIVKLLSDKKDLNSLYGKISIGFMLVQDAVAIFLMIILTGIETGTDAFTNLYVTAIKGLVLFLIILWLGKHVLPALFDKIAHSQELLFLASTAWVFVLAAIVSKIGFSIEIAGFLAGVALANSLESYQIAYKIRPLRDFFILIFFVILGASFVFGDFTGLTKPIITFSLFVLIGNPLIVLILMGLMGYRKHTSFLAGITVAQISEFSLILAALGLKLGQINEQVVALITAVGIITITLSTYLIIYGNTIYHWLRNPLSIFERKNTAENHLFDPSAKKSIVLVGFHRTGRSFVQNFPKKDLLVIDQDPDAIQELKKQGYDHLFGDIIDQEIFDKIRSTKLDLIVSTSPDLEDNLILIKKVRGLSRRPKVVVRAESDKEARMLYQKGADYVILPHFTSGHYLGAAIASDASLKVFRRLKQRDSKILNKI